MTYGSMPMSISRVTVDGASSVCSVESTRWPVCAACIAIFAVSWSRISPTRMTSGSWRRIERSALANVSFAFSLTCVWLTPGIWYSIGSSIVMMFVRPDLIERDRRAERRRLAAAGRADDEDHPVLVA